MRFPVCRRTEAVVAHEIVRRAAKPVRAAFETNCTAPPPADPVSAEYCDELTRNSAIDSMLTIRRATLGAGDAFAAGLLYGMSCRLLCPKRSPAPGISTRREP